MGEINMGYVRQTTMNSTFVSWGKPKGDHSLVVEKDKLLEGVISDIRQNDTYKYIFELKTKQRPEPVLVLGTTALLRLFGYGMFKDGESEIENIKLKDTDPNKVYVIQKGDKVLIIFKGMVKTKSGKDAYTFDVEVDDGSESYKNWMKVRNGKKK
jgi:hypothetical protein